MLTWTWYFESSVLVYPRLYLVRYGMIQVYHAHSEEKCNFLCIINFTLVTYRINHEFILLVNTVLVALALHPGSYLAWNLPMKIDILLWQQYSRLPTMVTMHSRLVTIVTMHSILVTVVTLLSRLVTIVTIALQIGYHGCLVLQIWCDSDLDHLNDWRH